MSCKDKAQLRRRSIGFVFQDFNLLAGLTASENVAMPLELDGVSAREARRQAMTALDDLGLAERAGHYPDDLAGGERQRVAIARAVVGDRRLLLADEPTGALDSAGGTEVLELFRALHGGGQTILLVTHDERVAAPAERVVHMRDGRLTAPAPAAAAAEV
jgi:putative ABC transport system ATP-binding protein